MKYVNSFINTSWTLNVNNGLNEQVLWFNCIAGKDEILYNLKFIFTDVEIL